MVRMTKGCPVEQGWEEAQEFVDRLIKVHHLPFSKEEAFGPYQDMIRMVIDLCDLERNKERARIYVEMKKVVMPDE